MEHRCASYLTFRAAWLRMWVASSLDKLVAMSRDEMNTRLRLLGSCTPLPTPQFAAKIDMLCKQFGSLWFSGGVRIQKVVPRANLARVVSCSSHIYIYIYHLCLLYIFFSSWCQPLQHWKGFLGSHSLPCPRHLWANGHGTTSKRPSLWLPNLAEQHQQKYGTTRQKMSANVSTHEVVLSDLWCSTRKCRFLSIPSNSGHHKHHKSCQGTEWRKCSETDVSANPTTIALSVGEQC